MKEGKLSVAPSGMKRKINCVGMRMNERQKVESSAAEQRRK